MTSHISLEQIDRSGALRELADEARALDSNGTRRDMLRRSGIAGAGFVAGGVLFNGMLSPAQAAGITFSKKKSAANDAKIANYALTLEYLEAAFYKAAVDGGAITDPDALDFARTVAAHEAAHVAALKKALGKAAVKSPTFDFGAAVTDQATFLKTAATVEPVGVSAYSGAGPYIKQLPILNAALAIHSVEANHAAWVAALLKYKFGGTDSPAPNSFNPARSEKAVLKIVTGTGFIKS
ncbi:MAG TPA: ferritin-like domain-containing protein [Baekduia sp.]|nr:ferritin-like domain-containing protein [Baekduia sp.]